MFCFWLNITAFIAQLNGLNSPRVDVSPKSKYNDRLSMDDGDADIDEHTKYCNQDEARRGII